jgi:6-phospho-beta-glucosidase
MSDKFSESGQKVIYRAIEVSKGYDHNFLSDVHVFTALNEVESGLFTEAMQSVGVDPRAVSSLLEQELAKHRQYVGKKMYIAATTRDLFNHALKRARSRGRQQIESYDLLAALFTNRDGTPIDILRRLGVDSLYATEAITQMVRTREEQAEVVRKNDESPPPPKNFGLSANQFASQDKPLKVTILGGGGIRTPLLIYALMQAQPLLGRVLVSLYDVDRERPMIMAALSGEAARQLRCDISILGSDNLAAAVTGADFIIHSIRVGGIAARARDERLAIEHGVAGQETTGVGGLAMALRTIPVVLEQARVIERHAPDAWFISFTNPAGLMTQALTAHTKLRVVGICDTPSEIFHRLAAALQAQPNEIRCDYFGLNHLGWVRRVLLRGRDVTARVLNDDAILRSLYSADLFDPTMIRALGMIPSEYLFFYYEQQRALANQRAAGASRGEEVAKLNADLFGQLQSAINAGQAPQALALYREYLRRRSGSYLKLEAEADSALRAGVEQAEDPFDAATGYHRIALDVITALSGAEARRIVLNVSNHGAIAELADDDVVEVPCQVDWHGPQPLAAGRVPDQVRGLLQSVKEYERLTIRAAVERSKELARLALLTNPLIGQWRPASRLIDALYESDPEHLGYLS